MARCVACGALLGPDAEWCGQCYALVRPARPEAPDPAIAQAELGGSAPVSTNGDAAMHPPAPTRPSPGAIPSLSAAAALAAIPPDLQITLASAGSSSSLMSLGNRGKAWVTASIIVVAASSEALFYPYARYMVVYGLFVSVLSGLAIWRLWSRRSVKR
jgi:hypothetical protein